MIPDWVKAYKKPGTTIKQIGKSYYLYSSTSKKVPDKPYPVSIQKYLGRITEEGLIDARQRIQISATKAKLPGDLVPDIPDSLSGIILLNVQKEWYYTKISTAQVRSLTELGLYKDEKLVLKEMHDA